LQREGRGGFKIFPNSPPMCAARPQNPNKASRRGEIPQTAGWLLKRVSPNVFQFGGPSLERPPKLFLAPLLLWRAGSLTRELFDHVRPTGWRETGCSQFPAGMGAPNAGGKRRSFQAEDRAGAQKSAGRRRKKGRLFKMPRLQSGSFRVFSPPRVRRSPGASCPRLRAPETA
jgi:hypothetical protein